MTFINIHSSRPYLDPTTTHQSWNENTNKILEKGIRFIFKQERTFKINLIRQSSQNFLQNLTQSFQSIYTVSLGASPLQLGLLNSLGGIAGALVSIPTGRFADRHGIKKTFLLGTPLMALGALLFAFAQNWIVLIPAIIVSTLALRIVMTACPMVCGRCLANQERARGMQLCDTLSAAPRLVAPILSMFLITAFGGLTAQGIRPLYVLQFVGLSIIAVVVFWLFSDPIRTPKSSERSTSFLSDIHEVIESNVMVKRWIIYICLSTIPMYVNTTFVPLYAAEVKNADQYIISGMASAATLLPLILSIPVGWLADSIGRKKVIYLGTPLYCLSFLLLIFASDPVILLLSGIFQGVFMLTAVTQGAMTAELVPSHLLGRWLGLLGLFRGVISVITPGIGGILWVTLNPESLFILILATQVLKIVALLPIPETLSKRKRN
jgi:MFS family permease